jgi:sugar lactone lactonase YvrE
MMRPVPRVLVPCANILGESPTWSTKEQALYWVDIRAHSLHRFQPATSSHKEWSFAELCPAVILAKNGVVIAAGQSLLWFDPQRGSATHLIDVEPLRAGNRLNEARADRKGRLWVGSMRDFGAAICGSLYKVTDTLTVERVLQSICIPNSLAWSPDNRTMYFADSADGVLRAYDYDHEQGSLGDARVLVPAEVLPGRPDGCAVDSEGCLWNARYGAGCVARIAPNGTILSTIDLPVSQPTSCALGGADLRTLYITTAAQRLSEAERLHQPYAGHLLAMEVDVSGLPEAEFGLG